MKPSEHAIEDWAKMVLSKPIRNLTEEEKGALIRVILAQHEIDSDKEIYEMLEKSRLVFLHQYFGGRLNAVIPMK